MSADEPNVIIPPIATQNNRGMANISGAVDNNQIKINSMWEASQSIAGETTLRLVKRPGATRFGLFTEGGGANDQMYLIARAPGAIGGSNETWGFYTTAAATRANNGISAQTILADPTYIPRFVDITAISAVENIVVQLCNALNSQRVYYRAGALGAFTEITDGDFTGLTKVGKMEFMDGWSFVFSIDDYIYNSDLNSLANWSAGNRIRNQIKEDVPRGLARFGKQIIAFTLETMSIYGNAGKESGSPLKAVGFKKYGLGWNRFFASNPGYYCQLGPRMYFLGTESGMGTLVSFQLSVYAYDGQMVEKVSTPFIDKILTGGAYGMFPFRVNGQDAVAIQITNVTSPTMEFWLFFPRINDWFKWTSTKFTPISDGAFMMGHGTNGASGYYFDVTDNYQDDGTDVTWQHRFQLPQRGNNRKSMPFIGVVGDTTAASSHPVTVKASRDGDSYTAIGSFDMASDGKIMRKSGSWKGTRWLEFSSTANSQLRVEKIIGKIV